jgi:hypothetical protein
MLTYSYVRDVKSIDNILTEEKSAQYIIELINHVNQ